MWKNIPIEAKERFGFEGWQRKISQNHPRLWSTCSQEYGVFTTPTVRWRLEQEAGRQKPASASAPWETTNSHYGARREQLNRTIYRQHVTSTANNGTSLAKNSRYQRSRYNPHPGIRLERLPGLPATRDDFSDADVASDVPVTSTRPRDSDNDAVSSVTEPVNKRMWLHRRLPGGGQRVPGIHERFLQSRYIVPWRVAYKSSDK